MRCDVMSAKEFVDRGYHHFVREYELLRKYSDFAKKIDRWSDGSAAPQPTDGHIALVRDEGQIIGWARTEHWAADGAVAYDTLEAFVSPDYRLRGVASFAASGLASGVLHENGGTVAVFRPHMMLVARRAGLRATLFERDGDRWMKA